MNKDPKYFNADGSFKGGFDGCCKYMMEDQGHSEESAKKICGYIAQYVTNRAGMNLPIGNRAADGRFELPADGWYHICPKGEFPHLDSQTLQVLDDVAMQAICNRFAQESQQANFPGLLVDFDHFSDDPDKSSVAAGWITRLQNRADGLWAQIRWSDEGQQALEQGRFRLISPTWLPSDVQPLGGNRIRPLRLHNAGLTNNPNLRGMVPLSNREIPTPKTESRNQKTERQSMNRVTTALGLAAEASPEAILTAVTQLRNRAETAEAALAPVKNRVTELETQNKAFAETQADADLERYSDRIAPDKKETWRKRLIKNRGNAIDLLEAIVPPKAERPAPIHNRAATQQPNPPTNAERAARRNDLINAIRNRSTVDFDTAWRLAQQQQPELFTA